MDDTISILIASRNKEDQECIIAAMSGKIDFHIAGIVKDETGAIIKTGSLKPDVLILDMQLTNITGPALIRIIRRKSPSTAIIILCDKYHSQFKQHPCPGSGGYSAMSPLEIYANLSIIAGISGFLIKESDIDKLAYIVKIIIMGGCYINSSITIRVFEAITFINQNAPQDGQSSLSTAERNIITFLADGCSDAEVADKMNYSIRSIKIFIKEIMLKTKTKSRAEIVANALVFRQIPPENLWICKEKSDIM